MMILKPKFWNEKNSLISLILIPISFFLQLLIEIKKRTTIQKSFKIPIICIGNIYLGGTGKTPLSIMLAKELINLKKKPAIIRKYYPEHLDEHNLINNTLDCLFVKKNRYKAIINAEEKKYNVAILDDGFQDFSIKKDLNILCFNSKQLIGNEMTLPSGPLREGMDAIKRTQIVIINGNKNELFEEKILNISKKVKIFYSKYLPLNIEKFKGKKLFAFAGIGNPNNFFELLSEYNLNVQKKIAFPDHYAFNEKEIKEMTEEANKNNFELITTEKDFYRIKDIGFNKLKYLKIDIEVKEKNNLMSEILSHL